MSSARMLLALTAAALAATVASSALAQGPVYRHVDADGRITYSDRPASSASAKVPMRVAPDPSAAVFDSAVNRSETDSLYYERQRLEDQRRRPVNIYDPRAPGADPQSAPAPSYSYGRRYGYDPNLPESPPPSSERRYYYEGR